jgi:hypothetical protein
MFKKYLLIFSLSGSMVFAQKIDNSVKEIKQDKPLEAPAPQQQQNTRENSSTDFASYSPLWDIGYAVTFFTFIGLYDAEDHLHGTLTPYPYFNGKNGNFNKPNFNEKEKNRARLDLENHFLYNNNELFGNHLKAKIRPFQYFYIQGNYKAIFEKNIVTNNTDKLNIYHFMLGYDRLRFTKCNFGYTIGAMHIANDVDKTNIAFGLNTEIFPMKNTSINASYTWSAINQTKVNSWDIKAKYHQKNFFYSLGFENLTIGRTKFNFLAIGGGIYF